MMGKELLIFLVILAISVSSVAAKGARPCSDLKNCRKCLSQSAFCVWQVGSPFSEGSCIESSQCDSTDGECLKGTDDKKENLGICGDSCETRTESGCEKCLAFDAMGRKRNENSDCAWYVEPGGERKCIFRNRCKQKGYRGGKCIMGKEDENNSARCSVEPVDRCEKRDSCDRCLRSEYCAWYTHGKMAGRCIHENLCEGFEGGTCTMGASTVNERETCSNLRDALFTIPLEPDGNRDDVDLDDRDEVGIEKCSDFGCTDCLNQGCSWINASKECVESCSEAPADVDCSSLEKPPIVGIGAEAPVLETKPLKDDRGNRALLRFEDEASSMCYDFKLEDKNLDLCKKAGTGGCGKCVKTQLYTREDMMYIWPPTCKWFPDTQTCFPFDSGLMGEGTDECEIDVVIGPYERIPPAGTTWPMLQGQPYRDAADYLSGTYGPKMEIERVPEKSPITDDYVLTRVRLFVTSDDIVASVPTIG